MKNKPLKSILETIGNTPLVELNRITEDLDGKILAKIEFFNPGFSKKDRIALQMIEDAERNGELKPGQHVVELTSGSTGTGLAIVCAIKGYLFTAVMSKGNSKERARMMAAFGAEVVLVDQLPDSIPGQVSGGDLKLVEEKTQEIVKKKNAFRANQFLLDGHFTAHYKNTSQEFLEQSNGKIDIFCDYVGSGGTFVGCSAAFKEFNPNIKCFIIEPRDAAILSDKTIVNPNHKIQGGGYSMDNLICLKPEYIDGYIKVSDEEAIEAARLFS